MIIKQFYEAPEAEIIEVNFEENILSDKSLDGSGFGDTHANVNNQSDPSSSVWHWME